MGVQYLWLQEKLGNKDYYLNKVLGVLNPADMMTKFLGEHTMLGHSRVLVHHAEGRSELAPHI